MGVIIFDSLHKQAIFSSGIRVDAKQLPNHALRPTAFCIHKSLGLSTEPFMSLAAHASARTHTTYDRKSIDLLTKVASNMQV